MIFERIGTHLPHGLRHYKSTPVFTADTIPGSLLTSHATKAGVWGLLRVERGRLLFCLDADVQEKVVVEHGGSVVIDPGVPHHVEILDADTAFHIEIHRAAGAT